MRAGSVRPDHVVAIRTYNAHLHAEGIVVDKETLSPITAVVHKPLQTPGDVTCGIWVLREVQNQVASSIATPAMSRCDAGPQAMRLEMVLRAVMEWGDYGRAKDLCDFARKGVMREEVCCVS